MAINETATGDQAVAITGTSTGQETIGVFGKGDAVGVRGDGKDWHGVAGLSESTIGGNGVFGANKNGTGVRGESEIKFNAGVLGVNNSAEGWGVRGQSNNGTGIVGASKNGIGVYGESNNSVGVLASSDTHEGMHAQTKSETLAAVAAFQLNPEGVGAAVHAETHGKGIGVFAKGGRLAGLFEGDVEITGKLKIGGHYIDPEKVVTKEELQELQKEIQKLWETIVIVAKSIPAPS